MVYSYLLRLGYDPEFIGQANAVGRLGFGLSGIPAGCVRFGTRRVMLAGESSVKRRQPAPGVVVAGWLFQALASLASCSSSIAC